MDTQQADFGFDTPHLVQPKERMPNENGRIFTNDEVRLIRQLLDKQVRRDRRPIAEMFCCSTSTIKSIERGHTYKDVI